VIFCDTSTLAKYYVSESESAAVRARLDREDRVAASEFARAELMAVFHRRLREGGWSRHDFQTTVRQLTKDDASGFWTWLPVDSGLLTRVARTYDTLPEDIYLRTADCIHLITALQTGLTEIYTHDRHQIRAAAALGLKAVTVH
jgi:predicted nucleic acid-binding protein